MKSGGSSGSLFRRLSAQALWPRHYLLLGTLLSLGNMASARQVVIGGKPQSTALDTQMLGETESIAVWTLPRLGVSVRNDPNDVRLLFGRRELRYSPRAGWSALGFTLHQPLPAPQMRSGSLYVPLQALPLLGVRYVAQPQQVRFLAPQAVPQDTLPPTAKPAALSSAPPPPPAPPPVAPLPPRPAQSPAQSAASTVRPSVAVPPNSANTAPPPAPVVPPALAAPAPLPITAPSAEEMAPAPPPIPAPVTTTAPSASNTLSSGVRPKLQAIRVGVERHRNIQVERVVLELSGETGEQWAGYQVRQQSGGVLIELPRVDAEAKDMELSSGTRLEVKPNAAGVVVELSTPASHQRVFTLQQPPRLVIDSTKQLHNQTPPPINPSNLPAGVVYERRGTLHLLSFDPTLYRTEVVSAPIGQSKDVGQLVRQAGGVAGINGGYFDTASLLPVDLVVQNGLMTASSLERRATLGFTPDGQVLIGYPKPRYMLAGAFGRVMVNSVRSEADPKLLTAFLGDGQTSVGASEMVTLYIQPGVAGIQRALTGKNVPPRGILAFTFHPSKFPTLPRSSNKELDVTLEWRSNEQQPWGNARYALSAGPLMVKDGRSALNAEREMFRVNSGIFKVAPQSAYGLRAGRPTLAYLESGTPESFARILLGAGFRDAVRLDSGSSSTIYTSAGYGPFAGYINEAWGRKVVNALVLVPKSRAATGF